MNQPLGSEAQEKLLRLARRTLEQWTSSHSTPSSSETAEYASDHALSQLAATFVSLHEHHELRGCIGNLDPADPLYVSVIQNTVSAATTDPRFSSVRPEELPDIDIEISVLSGYEPVRGPEDVAIGEHGLLVELGRARGLLLPQVAPQFGWNARQFLEHAARKAGLAPDQWREAKILRFRAQVFGESQKP